MSSQTEMKLSWPEIRLEYFPQKEETSQESIWSELRSFFQGSGERFANYLTYISTDFYGGINLCSILGENSEKATFHEPLLVSPGEFPISALDSIWEKCKKHEFEELDREDFELLGFAFLYNGRVEDFTGWVILSEKTFGLTDDSKRFLNAIGWRKDSIPYSDTALHALVEFSNGSISEQEIEILIESLFQKGFWQVGGVLFALIQRNLLAGEKSFRVWKFLLGLYSEFLQWEKEYFLDVSIGKLPPFYALRQAKKYLTNEEFLSYKEKLSVSLRGEWKQSETLGYDLNLQLDPLLEIINGYEAGGEEFFQQLLVKQKQMPYSFIANLLLATIYFRKKEDSVFLTHYEKAGRLKYLPIPLFFYARVLHRTGKSDLAESIELALQDRKIRIQLPKGWD